MSNTYETAFVGYEKYLDELRNLEAQPNSQILPISQQQVEKIVDWFHEGVTETLSRTETHKPSNAYPTFTLILGSTLVYDGLRHGDTFVSVMGGVLTLYSAYALKKNLQESDSQELELTLEQKRHMYAKFMLQSIQARTENE